MFGLSPFQLGALAVAAVLGLSYLKPLLSKFRGLVPSGGTSEKDPVDWTLREAVCCLDGDDHVKAWLLIQDAIKKNHNEN